MSRRRVWWLVSRWCSRPSRARRAGRGAPGRPAPTGKLIGGTLTPATPDARGWGWQVKASINPGHAAAVLQQGQGTALPGQADHELHDRHLQPGPLLRGGQALRLHLVRDAAQHDVVRRGAADDSGVPRRGRRADDPHAGCPRVEHSEGDRSRRHRRHRADRRRRPRGARRRALLALPAVRAPQLGRRDRSGRSGRA